MKKMVIGILVYFTFVYNCYAEVLSPLPATTTDVGKMPTKPDGVNPSFFTLSRICIMIGVAIVAFIIYKIIKKTKDR